MQFTVLIEFLVPGLLTIFLGMLLLPSGAIPSLPQGLPVGDTASALFLLAVSYPVGILTNFPVYCLQKRWLTPRALRGIAKNFDAHSCNLFKLAATHLVITPAFAASVGGSGKVKADPDDREIGMLFHHMRAAVFRSNIERLNTNHLYHEGLQRLARGAPLPLFLAMALIIQRRPPVWLLLVAIFAGLGVSACALLVYSIKRQEEQLVQFFFALMNSEQRTAANAPRTPDGP